MDTIYTQIQKAVKEGVQQHTWRGYSELTGIHLSALQRLAADSDEGRKHSELQTILKIFPEASINLGAPMSLDTRFDAGKQARISDREAGHEAIAADILVKLEKAVRESDTITDKLPVLSLLLQAALDKL